MKPSIAHFLVRSFVPEGGRVLDPFAGVGTIPFEACLQGKQTFGFEISPAALSISIAKVSRPKTAEVRRVLGSLKDYLQTEGLDLIHSKRRKGFLTHSREQGLLL